MNVIASGRGFSCLVQESGSVGCWGEGFSGTTLEGWKDDIQQVDFGENHTVKAVAAASHSICAILDNDSMKCSIQKWIEGIPFWDQVLRHALWPWSNNQGSCDESARMFDPRRCNHQVLGH